MKSRFPILLGISLLIVACVIAVGISRQDSQPQSRGLQQSRPHLESLHFSGEMPLRASTPKSGTVPEISTKPLVSAGHPSAFAMLRHPDRPLLSTKQTSQLLASRSSRSQLRRTAARDLPPGLAGTVSNDLQDPSAPVQPGPTAVDPAAPGNTLTAHGQAISVQAYEPTGTGNALTITSSPDSNPTPLATHAFTLEEELFRTKWGWQAYSQIQQTAAAVSEETN
jgi:hypothetical protein